MFDMQSQHESFSLANMVPQAPENNRGLWERIEAAVRKWTEKEGELFVVTGPIFQGENLQRIGGAVMIPTRLFKAVYNPKKQEAGAFLIDNTADGQTQNITITELEQLAGINLFPSVTDAIKSRGMDNEH
jgi:endonuclease G